MISSSPKKLLNLLLLLFVSPINPDIPVPKIISINISLKKRNKINKKNKEILSKNFFFFEIIKYKNTENKKI